MILWFYMAERVCWEQLWLPLNSNKSPQLERFFPLVCNSQERTTLKELTGLHAFSCTYPVSGWYTHIPLLFLANCPNYLQLLGKMNTESAYHEQKPHWWGPITTAWRLVEFLMYGQQSQVVSLSEWCHTKANSKTQSKPESLGTAEQRHKLSSNIVEAMQFWRPDLHYPGDVPIRAQIHVRIHRL